MWVRNRFFEIDSIAYTWGYWPHLPLQRVVIELFLSDHHESGVRGTYQTTTTLTETPRIPIHDSRNLRRDWQYSIPWTELVNSWDLDLLCLIALTLAVTQALGLNLCTLEWISWGMRWMIWGHQGFVFVESRNDFAYWISRCCKREWKLCPLSLRRGGIQRSVSGADPKSIYPFASNGSSRRVHMMNRMWRE